MEISKLEKRILLAQGVFVFAVLIYIFFATAPSSIYPLQGMSISEPDFDIEIENGETVYISTDREFSNPIILKENEQVELMPGTYFWKVKGNFRESEVKNFTIESVVGLDVKERKVSFEVENSGNVDLNVTKEKDGKITSMTTGVNEIVEEEKDEINYEGRQA